MGRMLKDMLKCRRIGRGLGRVGIVGSYWLRICILCMKYYMVNISVIHCLSNNYQGMHYSTDYPTDTHQHRSNTH